MSLHPKLASSIRRPLLTAIFAVSLPVSAQLQTTRPITAPKPIERINPQIRPPVNVMAPRADAQAIMRGVNAAVVGILAAALYDPLWKNAILDWTDLALALAAFLLLTIAKMPPLLVVVATTIAAIAVAIAA